MQMTQIKLLFSIFGDLLNPSLFSKLISLNGSDFGFKDDPIPNRNNLKRKETFWEYSSGFTQTLYLEELTDIFVQKFNPCLATIIRYIEENSLETKIFIVIEIIDDEKPSLFFKKEFMDMVVKMNGEIDIDLYIL